MPGSESAWFRRRLEQRHGFDTTLFRYPTTSESLDGIVERLRDVARRLECDRLHWIGHSLGGIVLLRMLAAADQHAPRPGRVVLLGTPACGSAAARQVAQLAIGRALIGRIVRDELLSERRPRWESPLELGVVAGTQSVGLGRFFARFAEPNDGTVALRETEVEGTTDRLVLPVSHLGMMLSARTVDESAHFLKHGGFSLGAAPPAGSVPPR